MKAYSHSTTIFIVLSTLINYSCKQNYKSYRETKDSLSYQWIEPKIDSNSIMVVTTSRAIDSTNINIRNEVTVNELSHGISPIIKDNVLWLQDSLNGIMTKISSVHGSQIVMSPDRKYLLYRVMTEFYPIVDEDGDSGNYGCCSVFIVDLVSQKTIIQIKPSDVEQLFIKSWLTSDFISISSDVYNISVDKRLGYREYIYDIKRYQFYRVKNDSVSENIYE